MGQQYWQFAMYNFLEQLSLFVSFAPWFNKPSYWSQFRIEGQDFDKCLAQNIFGTLYNPKKS
jgi:hypothetical protein